MTPGTGPKSNDTLTRRLLVPVLSGFAVIVLVVGILLYREISGDIQAEWNRKMDTVADTTVGVVEHLDQLSAIQRMVTHLAVDPEVEGLHLISFEDRRIVASSQHALIERKLSDLPPNVFSEEILRKCLEASRNVHQTVTPRGILERYVPVELTYLEYKALVPQRGCMVILLRPGDEARQAMRGVLTQGVAIAALLGLFLFVVLEAVRNRITEPLNTLARQVIEAGGESKIVSDERLGSEIRGLVRSYNSTLSGIKSRQALYQAQSLAFHAALEGAPLSDVLGPLTDAVPKIFGTDVRAAIFVLKDDRTGMDIISGMTADFGEATMRLPVGKDGIDSGLAIHLRESVIVPNVFDEPAWKTWLPMAERFDFRGCWSIFVQGSDEMLPAALSLYWREPRQPDDEAMQLLSVLTSSAAVLMDIHRQQRIRIDAQQKTAESQARFQVLFDESPDPYFVIDISDARILDCNPATERVLMCPRQGIIGKTVVDFSPPFQPDGLPSAQAAIVMMARIVESGSYSFEWLHQRSDGVPVPMMVTCAVTTLEGQKVVLVGWRDMTERKRQTDALAKARDFYLSLLDNAPALIWRANIDGECNWFNQTWINFTGRTMEQETGDGWVEGVHPEDLERCLKVYRDSFQRREAFEMEYRLHHCSGEYRWIMDFGVPIRNLEGEFDGYLGYCYDITERKRAEATLRQFKSTLDATHDCVFMFDPEKLKFFYVNQGACEQVGYTEAEMLQMHPYEIKPEWPEPKFRKLIAPLLEGREQSLRFETVHRHKDGHEVPVEVFLQLIAPPGEPARVVSIVTDITDRRRLQEALRQERDQLDMTVRQRTADLERAKDEAESATKSKSEFLANMSHEVRSPLTAVLGYADMLMDPHLSPDLASQAVQAIRRNGTHLLAILNDILDLSKIEAGRIDIELVAYSPWQLVQEVDSLLKVRAEELKVTIRSRARGPLPPYVEMDPTRVRQVLLNLVSNAVKFSAPGDTVETFVTIDPKDEPGLAEMTIEVKDEGIGMTPEQLKLIFQPFRQADTTTTRKYGGTGLGLSITQRMVELMHGSIEVRSEIGVGSSFTVRLPVKLHVEPGKTTAFVADSPATAGFEKTPEKPPVGRHTDKLKGRVLVAEDSEDIRRVISFMLGRLGLKPEVVVNGQEAYQAALEAPFDLILMDMQMPVMDGYAATMALRKSGYRSKIVALTAHSMSEDRDKCLNVGCDDYLTKPVNQQLLTETVTRMLSASN